MFATKFRELLTLIPGLSEEFDAFFKRFGALWLDQHTEDGTHGDVTAESLDVAGNLKWGTTVHGGLEGILTPPQITANQDNYNPAGLNACWMLRLQTDASRNITGLQAPTVRQIRRILLVNIGGQNIVLKEFQTSTTTNRFSLPGTVDLTLATNDAVWLYYDWAEGTPRWRTEGY